MPTLRDPRSRGRPIMMRVAGRGLGAARSGGAWGVRSRSSVPHRRVPAAAQCSALVATAYMPAVHCAHCTLPTFDADRPTEQKMQPVLPVSCWYCPCRHGRHANAPPELCLPAGHGPVHFALFAPGFPNRPASQGEHACAPALVLNWPPGHGAHAIDGATTRCLYCKTFRCTAKCPAWQLLQCACPVSAWYLPRGHGVHVAEPTLANVPLSHFPEHSAVCEKPRPNPAMPPMPYCPSLHISQNNRPARSA